MALKNTVLLEIRIVRKITIQDFYLKFGRVVILIDSVLHRFLSMKSYRFLIIAVDYGNYAILGFVTALQV